MSAVVAIGLSLLWWSFLPVGLWLYLVVGSAIGFRLIAALCGVATSRHGAIYIGIAIFMIGIIPIFTEGICSPLFRRARDRESDVTAALSDAHSVNDRERRRSLDEAVRSAEEAYGTCLNVVWFPYAMILEIMRIRGGESALIVFVIGPAFYTFAAITTWLLLRRYREHADKRLDPRGSRESGREEGDGSDF